MREPVHVAQGRLKGSFQPEARLLVMQIWLRTGPLRLQQLICLLSLQCGEQAAGAGAGQL